MRKKIIKKKIRKLEMKELIYPKAKNLQSFQTLDRFFIFNLYRADGTATAKKKKKCVYD